MRNDGLRSDLRGASVVTTPGTPGGVRGTRHQHNGSEEAGAMGKYPGIVSLYLTQLWSMNDHYDVMTLKIEQSGNMRTEYLLTLSDNNILPCNKQLNVKGIHSFLTKKILSDQDPKPVGDNNPDIELGERRSNLWQSANGLYWSVYFVSMSDWFASFDRQLDHHFLLSVCTIHGLMMQDKARCYFSSVSWAHLNLQMLKARLGLAVTKRLSRQIFPPFFVCLWLGLGSVPSHGYTVIIHSGPDNERISRNKMDPCLGQNTLTSAWPIAESSELRFESKLVQ